MPLHFSFSSRKLTPYEAGSETDESLAINLHGQLTDFKLDKVWNDEHYVTLQVQGRYVNMPKTVSCFYSFRHGSY